MNGLPGPYIKFFLRELGHEGTPCSAHIAHGARSYTFFHYWCERSQSYAGQLPNARSMGPLHLRVQYGPGHRTCLVRGSHRRKDRARARTAQVRVGPCLRGRGHWADVRLFIRVHAPFSVCAATDREPKPYFSAMRRWGRHRKTRYPTGDVRCRSCVRTYKRKGKVGESHK